MFQNTDCTGQNGTFNDSYKERTSLSITIKLQWAKDYIALAQGFKLNNKTIWASDLLKDERSGSVGSVIHEEISTKERSHTMKTRKRAAVHLFRYRQGVPSRIKFLILGECR